MIPNIEGKGRRNASKGQAAAAFELTGGTKQLYAKRLLIESLGITKLMGAIVGDRCVERK